MAVYQKKIYQHNDGYSVKLTYISSNDEISVKVSRTSMKAAESAALSKINVLTDFMLKSDEYQQFSEYIEYAAASSNKRSIDQSYINCSYSTTQ
tara:strand:- start:1820 stop:2101 length:282 start_codon:yes stop_codon:yes gene_type:complete